ncbi:MAG: hypothetical protein II038_16875 [Lachnospiraceae bacterium]|nr:hypothetical protein [Lachnospiraceae bacterium]
MKNREFWRSNGGIAVLSVVFYFLVFGLILLFASTDSSFLMWIVILPCAFFGWRALNRIQPAMFLWLSFVGWIVYFFVKLILSVVVGVFVAPYHIGRWIAGKIAGG